MPAAALELHKEAETFRVLVGNLQIIVSKYNQMLTTLLDVEKPLLERELASIVPPPQTEPEEPPGAPISPKRAPTSAQHADDLGSAG